jgi:hypothetical protein
MYKHTQTGRIMILSAIGVLAVGVFAGSVSPHYIGFYPSAAVALFIYFGFRDLTVEIDPEAVRLTFGAGFFKKEFKLRDIVSVRVVRNYWWHGWGIKYIGNGWMYNVAGLDAVELSFTNGKVARIGTDEPQILEAELKSRIK